jgi:acetyl esterase/lipase
MASWSALAIRLYIKYIRCSKQIFGDAQSMRKNIHDVYINPQSFCPPADHGHDIDVNRVDVNDWPLYRVSLRRILGKDDPSEPRRAMLYIHGGAFYREIDPNHWKFVFQVARETGLDVFVPIYPLIPRPVATAKQVVPGLVDICRQIKQDIVNITGDSAGGALALATMHHMFDVAPDHAKRVQSVVLISPVLDVTFRHPEAQKLDSVDPWLGIDGLQVITPLWSAGTTTSDPVVSPLHVDITRLPPLLLLSGTDDILNSDARRLNARFQGYDSDQCVAGSVQLERFVYVEQAHMIHVYPLLPHWEGEQARKLIMHFVQNHLT